MIAQFHAFLILKNTKQVSEINLLLIQIRSSSSGKKLPKFFLSIRSEISVAQSSWQQLLVYVCRKCCESCCSTVRAYWLHARPPDLRSGALSGCWGKNAGLFKAPFLVLGKKKRNNIRSWYDSVKKLTSADSSRIIWIVPTKPEPSVHTPITHTMNPRNST